MQSFKYWKRQQVEDAFGVERVDRLTLMDEWFNTKEIEITEEEKKSISRLQKLLSIYALDWNEAELKFHFLGPFMQLVDFYSKTYNPFVERWLTAKLKTESTSGKVDFLVAEGTQIPKAAYFCLHEYKPEEGSSNDASGQLLIAMVAAQQANKVVEKEIPLYGAFVIGRFFYFMVLNEKKYTISQPLSATEDDIFTIFAMMKKVKFYIQQFIR